jgi:hypothetical protein
MHMLISGEFNVSWTNCLQFSNVLLLRGLVGVGGGPLGHDRPIVGFLTGRGITIGNEGSSRNHKRGVPRISAATIFLLLVFRGYLAVNGRQKQDTTQERIQRRPDP